MLKLLYLENTSYCIWTFKFLSSSKCSCLISSMSCFSDLIYMTCDVEARALVSSISIFESRPNSTSRQVIPRSGTDIGLDDYAPSWPLFLLGCFQMLLLLSILHMSMCQLGFLTTTLVMHLSTLQAPNFVLIQPIHLASLMSFCLNHKSTQICDG